MGSVSIGCNIEMGSVIWFLSLVPVVGCTWPSVRNNRAVPK